MLFKKPRIIYIISLFIFSISLVFPQTSKNETTKSEALKETRPSGRIRIIKNPYPSYSLISAFLLIRKANEGDPIAQHELGLRYLLGEGFETDTAKAVIWLEKAALKGLSVAEYNYGLMFYNEIGVEWNPFNAYQFFKSAAEKEFPQAEFAHAITLTDNLIVNRNLAKAYELVKKSAESEYEPAVEVLAEFEKMGYGENTADTLKNPDDEMEDNLFGLSVMMDDYELDYLETDADALKDYLVLKDFLKENKTELRKKLGLKENDADTLEGEQEALQMISQASDDGSPEALNLIGRFYQEGMGYKKDFVKAVEYFLRAVRLGSYKSVKPVLTILGDKTFFDQLKKRVDANDPSADYVWAALVALNLDFQITTSQALEFLRKASESGHLPSTIELGLCYLSGKLVEKDEEKAREYFNQAAGLGSLEAEIRLAIMDLKNNADKEQLSASVKFLKEAGNKGSLLAQTALAFCYENGIGIKQNKAKAVQFYRLAASRGDEKAYYSLKSMYDKLRPDEAEFEIYE